MALGTDHNTTTTGANYIPEIWSNDVIAGYKSNVVMANLVRKINHKGKRGDTIHVPNFTRSDASSKTQGSQVTLIAPTHSVTNVSIDKWYEYSVVIEDIVEKQALSSLRRAYTDDAAYALAKQTDTDLHAQFETLNGGTAAGANNWDAAVIGGDGATLFDDATTGNGSDITDAGIRAMILQLDNADVPMSNRKLVIPPICKSDLMGLARFTEQAFTGDAPGKSPIRTGLIGEIYGMPVYVSSNCPSFASDDFSTLYRAGHMFHTDAVVHAEQMGVRTQSQYKQEYLGDLFTADCLYGVAEYRNDAGVSFIVPAT
jgi:N4-gp56 family major capsid protein